MKNNKLRIILIIIVVILLVVLIDYMFLNVFIGVETDKKISSKELVNIDDVRCNEGYCTKELKFTRLEDNTYNFEYVFENTTNNDLEKSCFKLIFSEEENHIFCIKKVTAGEEINNIFNFEDDFYSKYDDYSLVKMSEEDTLKYYDPYFKNIK